MSIVPMSYSTPETGATSDGTIAWGDNSLDITNKSDGLGRYDSITNGLLNYKSVVRGDNLESNNSTKLSSSYAYLPVQSSVSTKPQWYTEGSVLYGAIPSPYKGDNLISGEYNEAYGTTVFDQGEPNLNCLADFKGIINTKIITDLATAEDWRNLSSLSNEYRTGYYPAACCCARFSTTGTKVFKDCSIEELRNGTGFWYLPAIGELGYVIPRLADINDVIGKLNSKYGVGVKLGTTTNYWSSTEYSGSTIRRINTNYGTINYDAKEATYHVRAFLRL